MSKIVQAVNAMLGKKEKISAVISGGDDTYFFLFNDKYRWWIRYDSNDDVYYLYFYPEEIPLRVLADRIKSSDWPRPNEYVAYSTQDLRTKEGYETFKDLFLTVKEKTLGVDKVLDDIIEDLPF